MGLSPGRNGSTGSRRGGGGSLERLERKLRGGPLVQGCLFARPPASPPSAHSCSRDCPQGVAAVRPRSHHLCSAQGTPGFCSAKRPAVQCRPNLHPGLWVQIFGGPNPKGAKADRSETSFSGQFLGQFSARGRNPPGPGRVRRCWNGCGTQVQPPTRTLNPMLKGT